MTNPDVSIVVLTYNHSDLIDARLTELARLPLSDHNAEVVVLDNGSTDGTPLMFPSHKLIFEERGFVLVTARADENLGFAGGFNTAVGMSRGDIICLLSNDVRVFGDFIRPVKNELSEGRKIIAHEIVSHPAGWNRFGSSLFPWPNGYFLAMRREVWTSLGGFDERFTPHDYEDVDLGYRAMNEGIDLVDIPSLPVEHLVARTVGYSPDRYEHTVAMRALFAEKHNLPNIPERP